MAMHCPRPHTTRPVFRVPHPSPLQAVAKPSHACNARARWLLRRGLHASTPPQSLGLRPPTSLPRLSLAKHGFPRSVHRDFAPPGPDNLLVNPRSSARVRLHLHGPVVCLPAQSCLVLCPITLYFWRICCGSPTSPSAIRSGPSRFGLAKNGVSCCCSKMRTEFHTFLGPIK